MTKRVRKDRLSKWDDGENVLNDDQDDYISERSSLLSVEGHFRDPDGATANQKQQQQQQPQNQKNQQDYQQQSQYQDPYLNGEGPHTLRYFYNELPTTGIPAAAVVKENKKEEKRRLKEELKARRGQGQLVQGPVTQPKNEQSDNYYPYWYYYKAKNPDWIMRQQQYADAPFMPAPEPTTKIDLTEPENLPVEPKLTLAQRKARRLIYGDRDTPDMKYNRQRRRYEMVGKDGATTGNEGQQDPTSKQYVPLKDGDGNDGNDENDPRYRKNGRYSRTDPRGKLQTDYDWAEHYTQYMRNKSSLGNHNPNYKPNVRSKNHRSRKDYDPLRDLYGDDDDDENGPNGNRRNSHYYSSRDRNYNRNNRNNRYTTRSQQDYTTSSTRYGRQQGYNQSQTHSNQNYSAPQRDQNGQHRHGHTHNHGRNQHDQTDHHNISSKDLDGSGFKVVDASFRTGNGRNPMKGSLNRYDRAPPSIYNQGSYLPPITRDYHDRPHPSDYYGTQALTNDWKTLSYEPRMYKTNAQTKFYDRYLNNVIDKRLFA
ncbi:hypothetical protein I4U23_012734 [Adineta vaga]|nr:hypothetical protein I4U23_012734 [Adineta vaga]